VAYDDKLNGKISEDFWLRRTNAWQEEIAAVAAEVKTLQEATFDSFEKADALIKLCQRAPGLFAKQAFDEQTRLIRFIESNATFDGKTLKPLWKKPFDVLVEGLKDQTGGADETRTNRVKTSLTPPPPAHKAPAPDCYSYTPKTHLN